MGKTLGSDLENYYQTLDKFLRCTKDELEKLEGISETVSQYIVDFIKQNETEFILPLSRQLNIIEKEIIEGGIFSNKTFCCTGKVSKPRKEIQKIIEQNGGIYSSIKKGLSYLVIGEGAKEIEVARENGAQVVYATTSIEQRLEEIILTYFFGPFVNPDDRRDFFIHNVLQSSSLQYSFKKELVSKIIEQCSLLEGKVKSKLQDNLKKIMVWRNAFAHGRLEYDNRLGCCLRYYMGTPQVLTLDDEYWSTVETQFKETDEILSELHKKLRRN